MRISKKLPQFGKTAALLAVMGKQVAEFYEARDGEIRLLDEFTVQTPHYSDREGFFMNSYKSAGVMKSGFPYENKDDKIRQDFLRTLRTTIQKISRQCDFVDLYLFVPSYLHQEAVKALPAAVKDRLKGVITGTYYREHPFVLLDKLQVQTA